MYWQSEWNSYAQCIFYIFESMTPSVASPVAISHYDALRESILNWLYPNPVHKPFAHDIVHDARILVGLIHQEKNWNSGAPNEQTLSDLSMRWWLAKVPEVQSGYAITDLWNQVATDVQRILWLSAINEKSAEELCRVLFEAKASIFIDDWQNVRKGRDAIIRDFMPGFLREFYRQVSSRRYPDNGSWEITGSIMPLWVLLWWYRILYSQGINWERRFIWPSIEWMKVFNAVCEVFNLNPTIIAPMSTNFSFEEGVEGGGYSS